MLLDLALGLIGPSPAFAATAAGAFLFAGTSLARMNQTLWDEFRIPSLLEATTYVRSLAVLT